MGYYACATSSCISSWPGPRPDLLLRPRAMGLQDLDSTGQRVKIGQEKSGLAQLGMGLIT